MAVYFLKGRILTVVKAIVNVGIKFNIEIKSSFLQGRYKQGLGEQSFVVKLVTLIKKIMEQKYT